MCMRRNSGVVLLFLIEAKALLGSSSELSDNYQDRETKANRLEVLSVT